MKTTEKFFNKLPFMLISVIFITGLVATSLVFAIGDLGIVVEKMEGAGEVRQCKYCGKYMKVGRIPKDVENTLGNILREGISAQDVGYVNGTNKGNYVNLLIFRYDERIGGNLGAERPAGVGFHIHLMENNILKRTFIFDEDQQSLTENLFNMGKFFRRGAKWITAEELSRDAIDQGLDIILEDHK